MSKTDDIYQQQQKKIVDFAFDDSVVSVFPDMIRRSVPGYETVIPVTGLIAAKHVPQGGLIFDLGCSLGATSLAIVQCLGDKECKIVGVDNSSSMIEGAQANLKDERCSLVCDDIQNIDVTGANVLLMNFVLQFLKPEERFNLLSDIRSKMASDGLLIISEKIRFEDEADERFYDAVHLDYKRANGYSELEVSQKRTALENVMILDSMEVHEARFKEAGFSKLRLWYRCLNWVSYLVQP